MHEEQIIETVLNNPHFRFIHTILEENRLDAQMFLEGFAEEYQILAAQHQNDNPVLKEESLYYILPAISMYHTMQKYLDQPLPAFRLMWLHGAEEGARYLQKKAEEKEFLGGWCRNVIPKNEDGGAFVFKIRQASDTVAAYDVLYCPYVRFCREYGCEEIITVFCDSDDISFGNIHPNLKWSRTKTIGRGDDFCDFRYELSEE